MVIYCDIDGTICRTENGNYESAVPIQEKIDEINRMYYEGHLIVYWTARGATTGKDWAQFTHDQLTRWGCKFDGLRTDKPHFDVLIDDKAMAKIV